ncbi:MAG TPA: polysaccharide biosynthesis C-terminal domain-containing protein, partial [Thermomicrobiales bacterium]|nr:polysaccharide biosynthesis C-terminal domain-containing protein [Thermomicrobiales bacterium]
IGLNLLLVPQFGVAAAAVNTTIGYGALFVGVSWYMRRVCDPAISYDGASILRAILITGLPAIAAAILLPSDTPVGLLARVGAMLFVAILLGAGPLRPESGSLMRLVRHVPTGGPA